MFWKEHGDKVKNHLTNFFEQYQHFRITEPELNLYEYADSYIKNEIAMEEGMQAYFDGIQAIARYNLRILKAIKKINGKTFHKHLLALMKDSEAVSWSNWEIVSESTGKMQQENEYGKFIKQIWNVFLSNCVPRNTEITQALL